MTPEDIRDLAVIVKENGGGNFAASVFLREDGFFIQFNLIFLDRLRKKGNLRRFCELLGTEFQEALNNAEEKSRTGHGDGFCGVYVDNLSCLQERS